MNPDLSPATEAPTPIDPAVVEPSRGLRSLELALVLSIAFAVPLFSSIHGYLAGHVAGSSMSSLARSIYMLMTEAIGLSALAYVLFRQGRRFSDLGFSFRWRDLVSGGFLAVFAYFVYVSSFHLFGNLEIWPNAINNSESNQEQLAAAIGLNAGSFVMMFVNPFYEEMIVRAYAITELKALTRNTTIAVITSVLIQGSYHIYQGGLLASCYCIVFLIFSIFYVRTGKIMPVIIAHCIFDVGSLVLYALKNWNSCAC